MRYRLYVGRLTEIPERCEFSYYDSRKKRLFLLCDRKPGGDFQVVPESLYNSMTADEKAWFMEAALEIERRWMEAHQEDAAEMANTLLDLLEEELKKEAETAQNGEHESNGDEILPV